MKTDSAAPGGYVLATKDAFDFEGAYDRQSLVFRIRARLHHWCLRAHAHWRGRPQTTPATRCPSRRL